MLEEIVCAHHPGVRAVAACDRCGDFGCRACLPLGRSCVRCVPDWRTAKPDFSKSLGWCFQDRTWPTKILAGAACLIFSFLLLPAFLFFGYCLRIARREREAPRQALPDWDGFGELCWDGFKYYACILLPTLACYAVAGVAIGVVIVIAAAAGTSGGPAGPLAGGIATLVGMVCLVPVMFLYTYAYPALQIEYLKTGSVLAGFHFRSLWRTMAVRPFDYFLLFVCAFAIQFMASFAGELLCFVGLLATIPWALYTDAHFLGRTWAWNDSLDAQA